MMHLAYKAKLNRDSHIMKQGSPHYYATLVYFCSFIPFLSSSCIAELNRVRIIQCLQTQPPQHDTVTDRCNNQQQQQQEALNHKKTPLQHPMAEGAAVSDQE